MRSARSWSAAIRRRTVRALPGVRNDAWLKCFFAGLWFISTSGYTSDARAAVQPERRHRRVGHAAGLLRRRQRRVRLRPRRLRARLVREVRPLLHARHGRARAGVDRHRLDEPALRRRHRALGREGVGARDGRRDRRLPRPARTDTAWFHDHCFPGEVRFIRGRLRFGKADASAPFPSCLVVLGPNVREEAYQHRGTAFGGGPSSSFPTGG
jgi:hypothetical protein